MIKGKAKGKIFVISGPSGSGKTTLLNKLLSDARLKKKTVKSVSLTTRPKRSGEKEGGHYFFVSRQEFKRLLVQKKILEWTRYLGYYYATPRDFIEGELKKGKHIVLCLDLKGVKVIRRLYPRNSVSIFIFPPSIKALHERIKGRCQKTKKEEIRKRLWLARKEVRAAGDFNYTLLNENLKEATKYLREIVLGEINQKGKR